MPRHDVAIYASHASVFYDAEASRGGGGAERQTWLLARALARRGVRVAHIVYPVEAPVVDPAAPVTLVHRPRPTRHGTPGALAQEAHVVWHALTEADAAVTVFRGAAGPIGIGGLWARLHRRRVVFAGANNSDFTLATFPGPRDPRAVLYRAGIRMADALVVQSEEQARMAATSFPHQRTVHEIPSFVEPQPEANGAGEAFLWVSRASEYKRPLLYADLAAAVPEARFWMILSQTADHAFEPTHAELRRRAQALPNLDLLEQRRHSELQELISRSVAMVNTSSFEGMPNTWLEGWSRGVPAATLQHDPDSRIARRGLGLSAGGSWDDFVAGIRDLWARRADRGGYGPAVRRYIAEVHGDRVEERWADVLLRG